MKVILKEGSRPNEIGYHFTDIDGLLKILESDKMLSTNEPLDNKEIKRYNLKFPDNSEINISNIDSDSKYISQWLTGIPSDELNFVLKRLKNNKLKDKLEQFKGEYKAYSYNYLPFKNILGKKSWSYTRRPEGMSYRDMTTFGEDSVRISIDIDKLTEKGNKIVPFSWLNQPKSDRYNEYEERIFPRNGEFTPNFTQFITEIAVRDDKVFDIKNTEGRPLSRNIFMYSFNIRNALHSLANGYKSFARKTLKDLKSTSLSMLLAKDRAIHCFSDVLKQFYNAYTKYLNLEKEIEEQITKIITEYDVDNFDIDKINSKNSKIKLINEYINSKNPKIKLIIVNKKGKQIKNINLKTLINNKIKEALEKEKEHRKEINENEDYKKLYDIILKNKDILKEMTI